MTVVPLRKTVECAGCHVEFVPQQAWHRLCWACYQWTALHSRLVKFRTALQRKAAP